MRGGKPRLAPHFGRWLSAAVFNDILRPELTGYDFQSAQLNNADHESVV
jgi:hypothetical protein